MTAQPWWTLAGVVIGFSLGEGTRYARYRWDIHRNKRLVREELKSALAQLPQKKEILVKAKSSLGRKGTLDMQSVHVNTKGYSAVLEALYPHLTLVERNCLHVIYERLRVVDAFMDSFERDFLEVLRNAQLSDPWNGFQGRIDDQLRSLDVVAQLASAYLARQPIDVFGVEKT